MSSQQFGFAQKGDRWILLRVLVFVVIFAAWGFAATVDVDKRIAEWKAMLFSKDAQQRSSAATSLLLMKSDPALQALLETLRTTDDADTRTSILKAIGVHRDARCLEEVIQLLDSPTESVRQAASAAIETMDQKEAINRLVGVLSDPEASARMRSSLAEALARMRRPEAVPALIGMLETEKPSLRNVASEALRRITMLSLGPKPEPWTQWWKKNQDRSREEILEGVIRRQDARIEELARTTEDLWVERLKTRNSLQDPKPLLAALKSDLPGVRRYAVEEILRAKVEAAYPVLIETVRDPDPKVRAASAMGLARVNDAKSPAELILALEDVKDPVRMAAARSLGQLKAKLAVPRLTQLLQDQAVARAAAEALGKIGDPSSVPALEALLADPDGNLQARRAAATALGQLHDSRAAGPLLEALQDPQIRWFAVDALGELAGIMKMGRWAKRSTRWSRFSRPTPPRTIAKRQPSPWAS